ncbi:MAG: lytic transglycosylase domain-containing protein [Burkholderiales bacterium]|jgi:soluble lytic murein transglycosylase|nr:lytic transglycosylase domain-containing protein [Burkholderiales bacterium]
MVSFLTAAGWVLPGATASAARFPDASALPAQKPASQAASKPGNASSGKTSSASKSKTNAAKASATQKSNAKISAKPAMLSDDDAILAAKAAYKKKDLSAFTYLSARGHVLEPYLTYYRLLTAIEKVPLSSLQDEVSQFLTQNADTPLISPMLSAWQKKAGSLNDWVAFAEFAPPQNPDVEWLCLSVMYRFQKEGVSALSTTKSTWFSGDPQSQACTPVFDLMQEHGVLTVADILGRFRLAVENGKWPLARGVWARLPENARADAAAFKLAESQPIKYLQQAKPALVGTRELAFLSLEIAAQRDFDQTLSVWRSVRDRFSPEDAAYGNSRLAYRAARQAHPDALKLYSEAGATPIAVKSRTWNIRAALKAGDFSAVKNAIDLLPENTRNEDTWRYWYARALEAQKTADAVAAAKKIYLSLAHELSFYGVLSLERLGYADIPLPTEKPLVAEDKVRALLKTPAVQRIAKLHQLGLREEMLAEWRAFVTKQSPENLMVAADAMARLGLLDRSIAAVERIPLTIAPQLPHDTLPHEPAVEEAPAADSGRDEETASTTSPPGTGKPASPKPSASPVNDFAFRFPKPFNEAFKTAAGRYGVDESLLYAVARQESRFVPHIFSSAGATGLMQLMPGTARWVAKQLSISSYNVSQLKDPGVNLSLGAFYLRYCLDEFGDSVALAAGAYNAGPHRARRWQADFNTDGDIWVETIPFDETRDYVKKVMLNHKVYAQQNGVRISLLNALHMTTPFASGNENVSADDGARLAQSSTRVGG